MSLTIILLIISTFQVRVATSSPYAGTPDIFNCNDLCFAAKDGECDDGGPGSITGLCPYGSDCADCGMRAPYTRRPTVPPTGQTTSLRTSAPVNGGGYQSTTSKAPTKATTKSPTKAQTTKTKTPTVKPTNAPNLRPTKAPTKKKAKKNKKKKKKKKANKKQG